MSEKVKDHRTAWWVAAFAAAVSPLVQWLIERFSFGVVVLVGRRLWTNAKVCSSLGQKRGFANTAEAWFQRVYAEEAEEVRALYETHRAEGWPNAAIIRVAHPDGGHRMIAFTATDWGPVDVWVLMDVTEEVRDSEHFRILFERSNDPHLVFGEHGIVECNEAAVRLLGYETKAAVLAKHPAEFSPERQPDGRLSSEKSVEMDGLAQVQGFHRFEWSHQRMDGTEFPVEVSLTPVSLPSGPGHLVVWHDLTERLEKEHALEEAARAAEEGLRARQAFLASMSHEIRTPMNGVLGLVDAILDDTELAQTHRDMLEAVHASGESLRQLLDDLLDFSKYEAGDLELEHVPFDLGRLIEMAVDIQRGRLNGTTTLRTEIAPGLGARQGDSTRVSQIVSNLTSNAVKFTAQGEVRVSAEPGSEPGSVLLQVHDSGIGMTEEQLGRIFEPFKQAEAGSTRRFGGTGLGLAIVDRLVNAMGGRIEVESQLGEGSCFSVYLPLPPAATPMPLTPARASAPLDTSARTLSVLVAEDNQINQLVLRKAFEKHRQVQPSFVETGVQALEAVAAEPPDLVIMDVHMPVMDGLEATRQLRQRGYARPIVALTASCLESELRACLEAGMNEILRKPLDREALGEMLKRYQSHKK